MHLPIKVQREEVRQEAVEQTRAARLAAAQQAVQPENNFLPPPRGHHIAWMRANFIRSHEQVVRVLFPELMPEINWYRDPQMPERRRNHRLHPLRQPSQPMDMLRLPMQQLADYLAAEDQEDIDILAEVD